MSYKQRKAVFMENQAIPKPQGTVSMLGGEENQPSILSQFFHRLAFFELITSAEEIFLLEFFRDYLIVVNWWDIVHAMALVDGLGLTADNFKNGYNPVDTFIGQETESYYRVVSFECLGITYFGKKVSNNCRLAHRVVSLAIIFKT